MADYTPEILDVYIYGAPVLRRKTRPLETISQEIRRFIADMILTMYEDDGIGLSANQVGKSISIFVVGFAAFEDGREDTVFINPEILELSEETEIMEEGCLSIPGIRENVPRALSLCIRYRDSEMKLREESFSGFAARVIQHEYDHLNGVFFTDRIGPVRKMFIRKQLAELSAHNVNRSNP